MASRGAPPPPPSARNDERYVCAGSGGLCEPVYTLSRSGVTIESDEHDDPFGVGDESDEQSDDGEIDEVDESDEVDTGDD